MARLAAEFPSVDPDVIGGLLEVSLGRTHGARVQHYRLVLAERAVRSMLRKGHVQSERCLPDDRV